MPRTKIRNPNDETELLILTNINYELGLKGYGKNDLEKILGLSMPSINQRYKHPRRFKVSELMLIANWCRVPLSNFFIKRVAEQLHA